MDPSSVVTLQLYGLWIQTGAIVVSAIAASVLIARTSTIAKRRATLDLIMAEHTHRDLVDERTAFAALLDKGYIAQYAAPDKADVPETTLIRANLNRYELVAIGVRKGTLDETTYKSWCRTTLVKDWIACKPFIVQLRQNKGVHTYFCEFESLARKWASDVENPHC